ncbi:MAG: hypothetical protein J7L25_13995 [Deltaproteobacteria bacterium]|nr:hypothetical protein [Candidatus Tharpella aukensis]
MSIPGVDISCDRCDYRGATGVVFGIFKYRTQRGNISLPRDLGWCSSCDSLAPIEETALGTRRKSLEKDLESINNKIEKEKRDLLEKISFFKRIFSSPQLCSETLTELQKQAEWFLSELSSPVLLVDYLCNSREPRCLTCGSDEVYKVPQMPDGLNDFYDDYRVKIPIGMKHPGCGGQLLASTSEVRLNRRFRDRVYDLSGKSIT